MPQAVSSIDCDANTAQQHQSDTCYVKLAALDVLSIVVGTWTGPNLDRGPGPEVRKVRDLAAGPGPAATFLRS